MSKKWEYIYEIMNALDTDDTFDTFSEIRHLKRVTYAPNIAYHSWIFRYKGYPVSLFNIGNGHYRFHSAVSNIDVLIARISVFMNWLSIKFKKDKTCTGNCDGSCGNFDCLNTPDEEE